MSHGEPAAGSNPYGGTDYYCDPVNGSDTAAGTSAGTAVADIEKLWNNTHGTTYTPGVTLTNGDRVFIRSEVSGSDVVVTPTVDVADYDYPTGAPVDFIVDDGSIDWGDGTGDEGYFTFLLNSTIDVNFGANMSVIGSVHSVDAKPTFKLSKNVTSADTQLVVSTPNTAGHSCVRRLWNLYLYSNVGNITGRHLRFSGSANRSSIHWKNILIDLNTQEKNYGNAPFYLYRYGGGAKIILETIRFENTSAIPQGTNFGLVSVTRFNDIDMLVRDVDFSWAHSACGLLDYSDAGSTTGMRIRLVDIDCGSNTVDFQPRMLDYSTNRDYAYTAADAVMYVDAAVNGGSRAAFVAVSDAASGYQYEYIGNFSRRWWYPGTNQPTLQSGYATLPDGTTAWSVGVTPPDTPNLDDLNACELLLIDKYTTGATGTKTLKVEFCAEDVATFIGNVDKDSVWMELEYEDASGNVYFESSKNLTACTITGTGAATWSSENAGKVTYGTKSFTKYYIEYTTKNAIKQNSFFKFKLLTSLRNNGTTGSFIMNPDVGIT